jgi:8-oxo-dGTP pyrophosphatase MutT (NUDIX family)
MRPVIGARDYNRLVIDNVILAAVHRRLARALTAAPIRYHPFVVDGIVLGWLDDARFARLARFGSAMFRADDQSISFAPAISGVASRSALLADIAQALRAEGALPGWRNELYAVGLRFDGPAMFALERGAARWFGVRTWAAHVNGTVDAGDNARMWIARRSPAKAVDPGRLDNLVGGGIRAGARVADTVIREAWEEAGIGPSVARRARPAGMIHVRRALPDGLQRESVFVHDLALGAGFVPANQDGEAVEHRLVDLREAARLIAIDEGPDEMTIDASLVVLDYLIRRGAIAADADGYAELEALRSIGIAAERAGSGERGLAAPTAT